MPMLMKSMRSATEIRILSARRGRMSRIQMRLRMIWKYTWASKLQRNKKAAKSDTPGRYSSRRYAQAKTARMVLLRTSKLQRRKYR